MPKDMSVDCNRIEIEVPRGKVIVRHASCPNGCDLMDPEVKIHDHPSIHLVYSYEGVEGHIHLDPVYGMYENVLDREIPNGIILKFHCPGCNVSLTDPDTTCSKCSAPMFALHLPEGGSVEACQRNGCSGHRMRIVTGEQMMQRLFDDVGMDSYL